MGKRFSYKQMVLAALLTGIVSFGVSMSINYFQNRKPQLVFSIENGLPYENSKENLSAYQITVKNEGKGPATDVIAHIQFDGVIKNYHLNIRPTIKNTVDVGKSYFHTEILNLNPNEGYVLSILIAGNSINQNKPKIDLESKGYIGQEISVLGPNAATDSGNFIFGFFLGFFVLIIIAVVTSAISEANKKKIPMGSETEKPIHSEDLQNDVLAFIYGINGLSEEAERLISTTRVISYWSEADRVSRIAIFNKKEREARKKVLLNLIDYGPMIASTSVGVIYYNLARISNVQKKKEEVEKYLSEARKFNLKLVEARLKIDPVFRNKN